MSDENKQQDPDTADVQPQAPEGPITVDDPVIDTTGVTSADAEVGEGLLTKIAFLEQELGRIKEERLRTLAEAENIRRRAEKEKEDGAKFAIKGFAQDLLGVADNLGRAIQSIPAELREGEGMKNIVTGIEMTQAELRKAFEKNNLIAIDPIDQAFDPHVHQAMVEVEGTGKPAGTVVQVYQPGYALAGRLLRPALVGVAKAETEARVDTSA